LIELHTSPKKRNGSKGKFTLGVHSTMQADDENNKTYANDSQSEIKPKFRANGGVWIQSSDFPFAF
jgi:hypothetical protein